MPTRRLVIDLSHHQGGSVSKVDGLPASHWRALKRCGVVAAVVKVSQGTGHVDEDGAIHVKRARASGMDVGLYHFADGSDGTAQADHFIAAARRANGGTLADVALVIDVENNPDPAGSDAKGPHVRAIARRLAAKAPRNTVLVYTGAGYWYAIGNPDMASEVDGLWQARWDGERHRCKDANLPAQPPRAGFGGWAGRPRLWQFGPLRYTVNGKLRSIDGNAFYGSLAALHDLFRTTKPAKPKPTPTPPASPGSFRAGYNALIDAAARAAEAVSDPAGSGSSYKLGVVEARADVAQTLAALRIGSEANE